MTRRIASNDGGIRPTAVYPFIDKLTIWLKDPLSAQKFARLQRECGGRVDKREGPARFSPVYRQRLQLLQPKATVEELFAGRSDVHLNYAEFSLDWIFEDGDAKDAAFEFFARHHIKRNHRDQEIRFFRATRYSGPRTAPNVVATYHDKVSKVSGEIYCVHLDWRIKGIDALKRAGIKTLRDAFAIDHVDFWHTRLLMFELEVEKIGRLCNNHHIHTRRRVPWITRYGSFQYHLDRRAGHAMMRRFGSVQAIVDLYRKQFDVSSCLVPINVDHLLPQR